MAIETVALWIQYDGANYCGWQRQLKQRSVQGVIERALKKLLLSDIVLHASGRTDAGVHAYGQCASFRAELIVPIEKLSYTLNNLLPDDIYITQVATMPDDFHARFNALGKTYLYKLFVTAQPDPFKSRYYYQIPPNLDENAILMGMEHFVGTHDFRAFKASGSMVQNTVRTIIDFKLEKETTDLGAVWTFTITGDGFLYNMVRIIIGTLLRVGSGKLESDAIPEIIERGDRHLARWTAPPQGLYLKKVYYENEFEWALAGDDQDTRLVVEALKRNSKQ